MSNLNFTTLETYTTWRSAWRETYKALSLDIRKRKITVRTKQKTDGGDSAGNMQSELVTERNKARQMMEDRIEAKLIARDLWMKLHDVVQVAA